jgi:nitrate reductase beta subunit
MIESAQRSPVYKFVKEWELALPLHPEFRTLPMLFYVPPMLPVLAGTRDGQYEVEGADAPMLPVLSADGVTTTPGAGTEGLAPLLSSLAGARLPMQYLANLFTAGNVADIEAVYRKLIAVRIYMRHKTVGDIAAEEGQEALAQAGISSEVAEAMHKLTALPTFSQRFQVPPMAREMAVETQEPNALHHKREAGFGRTTAPKRRF